MKKESRPKQPLRPKGKRGAKRKVRFEIAAEPGSRVYMAGSFNNWDALELNEHAGDGKYSKVIALPQGQHEYKFIVNDMWLPDLRNPRSTVNAFGSLNSVIEV